MTNTAYTPEEPIAAIATALAPGAIAMVRCSGRNCIEQACSVFSRPNALRTAEGNSLIHGWIVRPENGERIDEVMLGVYRAPKSFTGEDMVEICCHGGLAVVRAVLAVLLQNGFRQAERGEFTFRAYINGKTDLTRAEAVKEIIESKTDSSRGRAAGRLAGNLFAEIDSVKHLIIDTLAAIEVAVEYPEDEETIADSFDPAKLREARARLQMLADSWKSEKLYQDGARVVLCGRTNAGKSSLFNTLLKEERSIVSDIAGTTRDWLESWVSFDGIPVRLFDTAGLRKTEDVIEAAGVERTRDLTDEADLLLYLVDAMAGLCEEDREFLESHRTVPVLLVWNKCDSDSALPLPPEYKESVAVSAKRGLHIAALTAAVARLLGREEGSDRSRTGLGSERQKEALVEALERLCHALDTAESGSYGLDAVVQDLEDSLGSLGELTGEGTPEDVLSSVLSQFCVGK